MAIDVAFLLLCLRLPLAVTLLAFLAFSNLWTSKPVLSIILNYDLGTCGICLMLRGLFSSCHLGRILVR